MGVSAWCWLPEPASACCWPWASACLVAHVAAKPIEDVASATARIRAFGADDERLALPGHLQEPHWLAQSLNRLLDRVSHAEAAAG